MTMATKAGPTAASVGLSTPADPARSAISVITNNGLVPNEEGNKHNEVLDVATLAGPKLDVIFGELISSI